MRSGTMLRTANSERTFTKNANRSMDPNKNIKDYEKYFDFVISKKSLDNFRLEKQN